jgi:glyoxylase-like metal-dependent hydrolase (beta-lactamase superfamily II)
MSWTFTKGLHDIGPGHYAYLQPDGTWGYSNAGLVVDGEQSLLVDTLFDERLTADMLSVMKDAAGIGGAEITTLVNTHANGDHTYGNRLVTNAEIIASASSAREMLELPPERMAELMRAAPHMGDVGDYFLDCFGDFDFSGITLRAPTRTFTGQMEVKVGDKSVRLIEVGPAHTHGDVIVHVPQDKVIYTGDILFIDGTPIMWAGPVGNWIKACDLIIGLDAEVIVPGHGPLTDKAGVARMRDYLVYIDAEAKRRFAAGMDAAEAARDIALGDYDSWIDAERIVVNVDTLYREYRGDTAAADTAALFGQMGRLKKDRIARGSRTV